MARRLYKETFQKIDGNTLRTESVALFEGMGQDERPYRMEYWTDGWDKPIITYRPQGPGHIMNYTAGEMKEMGYWEGG